ncbi:hypothetical protein KEJ33_05810 [Candidatus Bathyarchaeota archaeon]|nr:hypothetical protein [Candidatus Bathyarchaeota archaeon]
MQTLRSQVICASEPCSCNLKVLTTGVDVLANILGGLRCGGFAVVRGSRMCHVLSELLCVRCQLPDGMGGVGSSAVFVDGGNLFDPYLASEVSLLLGLEPETALSNIWVSRAFTSHQMTALLTERLCEILNREGSRLVVVSDIAELYCDLDIGVLEAKRTFNNVTCFLWNLAREKRLLAVSTSLASRERRKRQLEHYLLGRADVVVRVDEGNAHLQLTLEKHPSEPPFSMDLCFDESVNHSLLEDYLEA